jgi:hypothetical protein
MNENTALYVARKLETASVQARKFEGTTDPEARGENRATMKVFWEGRAYRVTVQDIGPEED